MKAVSPGEPESVSDVRIGRSELPSFTISEERLGMGASLGNSALWIHTKGTGAIQGVYLNEVGERLIGTYSLRYGGHVRSIAGSTANFSSDHPSDAYSGPFPDPGSRIFEIHPAYQRVRYRLASILDVSETTFLPLRMTEAAGQDDPPIVYVVVELFNSDEMPHRIRVAASAMLRGNTTPDVQARYDDSAHALVAVNRSRPELVRVMGLSEAPTAYGCDFDVGGAYDLSHIHSLKNDTSAVGDPVGRLQLDVDINGGERCRIYFTIALYAVGEEEALRRYAMRRNADAELEQTIALLKNVLFRGQVMTPDPIINDGALWSKVNMRRVMASYPTGVAFTNDPGQFANVVIRDSAWFVYGNDHFLPAFSRALLDNIASRQYANGKLPEYFDAVTGRVEDDGLNINDDTPLYILAANHHFRASGDLDWLRKTYPAVARAARYIITQIDGRGLVFCSANDPRGDVWSIAGWRNIISGYSINGAVTEINAECVAALRAASHLADNLGGFESDRDGFADAAKRVRQAMDENLINPENGLYYLNVDVEGNAHTDVTGDEIFPVIMRACEDEVGFRIISRLNCADFWTSAGLRTLSRLDPRYDPVACSGLLGGVWPGLTWWYAFAAAQYHPEFMVRALRSSFQHYGVDPRIYNTVPGQFSEWFDGESLSNRGMRLSPWEPPRFLWAAIEGVCGLMLTPGPPRINPLIPAHWKWVGLRNLAYHGGLISYFLVREGGAGFRVYSTGIVDSDWDVSLYHEDASDYVRVFSDAAAVISLSRDDGLAVFIGNTSMQTIQSPLSINARIALDTKFNLRTYNSERGDWEASGAVSAMEMRALSLNIEANGFRVLEFSLETSE